MAYDTFFPGVVLLSICILLPLGTHADCTGQECTVSVDTAGYALLQRRAVLGATQLEPTQQNLDKDLEGTWEPSNATISANAQFLIQATFGPTREAMHELDAMSYQEWIKAQMSEPVGSHREYFRMRVNPRWHPALVNNDSVQVPVCSKGSRWQSYAINDLDCGWNVTIQDSKLFVKNGWRTDVKTSVQPNCTDEPSPDWKRRSWTCSTNPWNENRFRGFCSGASWKEHGYCQQSCFEVGRPTDKHDCSGGWVAQHAKLNKSFWFKLCQVDEVAGVGGLLKIGIEQIGAPTCKNIFYMLNPSIWLSNTSRIVKKAKPTFEKNPRLDDVIFLKQDLGAEACGLIHDTIVDYEGRYFRHDARQVFLENTPGSPMVSNACVRKTFLNEGFCRLQPATGKGCAISCGSPGEVANSPVKGAHYTMWTKNARRGDRAVDGSILRGGRVTDYTLDDKYSRHHWIHSNTKSTVWTMKVFQSKDQLRQRMAWALSQIHVISKNGPLFALKHDTEPWIAFYDIFVRNAFGNFRDVMREITYSPMMGRYLTFVGSRSFDTSNSYADENYARELMQLFTIGPDTLDADGSIAFDIGGNPVPAYTNENIMVFARALTGFKEAPWRANLEMSWNSNRVDPMSINPKYHDKYPKPDLHGGYLGDGYPLCTDLPKQHFLAKGARYEFLGYSYEGASLHLDRGSGLFGSLSKFALTLTLKEDVSCFGKECSIELVNVVQVGEGFYEYVQPACVHLFVSNADTTLQVHHDGFVSTMGKNAVPNKFRVNWKEGRNPGEGSFEASVTVSAVFSSVPDKTELLSKLKIGSFAPKGKCSHSCEGEVKAYAASKGKIDEHTVFEHDGNLFKNIESTVHLSGDSFRTPPVFMPPPALSEQLSQSALRRKALLEVESLLDHLFHHPNTPLTIGRKLIQRFVASHPSSKYVQAVANAFRTGTFASVTYSGKYGDLGATVAAVLLHPEAREQTGNRNGLLREPLLKLIHLMRSMEYVEYQDDPIVLNFESLVGQFPYNSPTVFNFYHDDFVPGFANSSGKAIAEPVIAPEFEIFTPQNVVNWFNGLSKVLQNGITHCWSSWGYRASSGDCVRGGFNFSVGSSPEKVVKELDIMLTGGRLTPLAAEAAKDAYVHAAKGKKMQAAQKVVLFTPEFNTLGDSKTSGVRPAKPSPPEHEPASYKAVVILFMFGGADTFQMLVPRECSLHDEYAAVRKGINIGISDLLPIEAATQKCSQFGIHPKMPHLHKLYKDKEAAFISNVGQLGAPVTRSTLRGSKSCHSFSHSHGQILAQTLKCGGGSVSVPLGVGGRMADELAAKKIRAQSFSFSRSTWSQAEDTITDVISAGGSVRLSDYDLWHDVIFNMTSQRHNNLYCDNYAQAFEQAVKSSEKFRTLLNDVKSDSLDKYPAKNGLEQQLKQVARVMATRKERKIERDLFFVATGGWDMHQGVKNIGDGFEKVDKAISGFVTEMKSQNLFDSVVLTTASEFGRTLPFNGQGTDHGWGGNHIIVGGGINGGQVFNDFIETYQLDSEMMASRARVIPKYPFESVWTPIAEWMGVDNPEHIFPQLVNFNRSQHIISRDALFKSGADAGEKNTPPATTPEPTATTPTTATTAAPIPATEIPTTPAATAPIPAAAPTAATTPAPTPRPTPAAAPAPTPAASTKSPSSPYYQMDKGRCCCPNAGEIKSQDECTKAHDALGLKHDRVWRGNTGGIPGGCSTRQSGGHNMHWNGRPGKARRDMTAICKKVSDSSQIPVATPAPTPAASTKSPSSPYYYEMDKGTCCCPNAGEIKSQDECAKAHDALGLKHDRVWRGNTGGIPGGCSTRQSGGRNMHWNGRPGRARRDMTAICKTAGGS